MSSSDTPWPEMTTWARVQEAMRLLGLDPDSTFQFGVTHFQVDVRTSHSTGDIDLNTVPLAASITKRADTDHVSVEHHFQIVDHPDLMKLSKQGARP